jgi:hypothetical protein
MPHILPPCPERVEAKGILSAAGDGRWCQNFRKTWGQNFRNPQALAMSRKLRFAFVRNTVSSNFAFAGDTSRE